MGVRIRQTVVVLLFACFQPLLWGQLQGATSGQRSRTSALLGNLDDPQRRDQAADELCEMGSAAVPDLVDAMKDSPDARKAEIVRILGLIADPRGRQALEEGLEDRSEPVRRNAARALGQLGMKESVPSLVESLKDTDPEVRSRAAFALGEIGDPSAFIPVLRGLSDEVNQVRDFSAVALGRLNEPRAAPALVWALANDTSPYVRAQSATSLSDLRVTGACGALVAALDDSSDLVRRRAYDALLAISGQKFPFSPRGTSVIRAGQVRQWRSWHESARDVLGVTSPVSPARLLEQLAPAPPRPSEQPAPPPAPATPPAPARAAPPNGSEQPAAPAVAPVDTQTTLLQRASPLQIQESPAPEPTPRPPEPRPASVEPRAEGPPHPGRAFDAFSAGTQALSKGDWQEARELLGQAVASDPQWTDALYNLAIAQFKSGDGPAAIETLRRTSTLAPTDVGVWALLGAVLWSDHDLAGAREALQRASELPDAPAEVLSNLGAIAVELRDYPTAARCFTALQERGFDQLPEEARAAAHLRAGIAFFRVNRLLLSLEHLERARALKLRHPLLAEYLGHVYRLLGREEEAVLQYREALARGAGDDSRSGLASSLMALESYQEARVVLDELTRQRPWDATAWRMLAVCLEHLGMAEEAGKALGRARALGGQEAPSSGGAEAQPQAAADERTDDVQSRARLHPDDPGAQYRLGTVLEASGRFREAEQRYRAAVELAPASLTYRRSLVKLLLRRDRVSEAEAVLESGGADEPELLGDLAELKATQGDVRGARDLYRRLVSLGPKDARWWLGLGRTCDLLDELDGALESLRKACQVAPRDAEAWSALARFYLDHRGEDERWLASARDAAARAVALSPTTAEYHALLAEVDFRSGRTADAVTSIDKALLLEPDDESFQRSRRLYLAAQEAGEHE